MMGPLVVTVNERLRRLQQSGSAGKEFTRGDVAAEVPPQQVTRVEPGAVGRHVESHQPPGRGADHGFACMIIMGVRVIPGHLDGACGVLVDQGLRPCGDLAAPCAAAEQPHGFARLVVDGAQTLPLGRLPWGGKHDLLALWAPQRAQRGHPPEMAVVGVVKDLTGAQLVARLCTRLVLT
jgi:hypothetical protein